MSKIDFSEAMRNLNVFSERTLENAEKVMDYTVGEAENHAKRTAPWTDRTGNARRSINSKVWNEKDAIVGGLGIGVEYGKYLELSNQGKYRVIRPTMDIAKTKLMNNLKGMI